MIDHPELITDKKQTAIDFFNGGQLMEAKALCEELIDVNDQEPEILCMLSAINGSLGLYENAVTFARKAINLYPNYTVAHSNLALALLQTGDLLGLQEAVDCFKLIIEQDGQDYHSYANLGHALLRLGRNEEAIQSFKKATQINTNFLDAVAGEASALERLGDAAGAYEKIHPHLFDHPINPKIAIVYGAISNKPNSQQHAIELIDQALDDESLSPNDAMQAHFALGSLYDRLGRFDYAFLHYQQANQLKPTYFDRLKHSRTIDHLTNRFNKHYLQNAPHSTITSNRPIFVVGTPRSGTSLVEQILSTHPDVYGAGELSDINRLVASLPGGRLGNQEIAEAELDRCANDYLEQIHKLDAQAARVVDKLPQNFINLAHIEMFFPNCQIIHCKRDPLDTCLSCYFQSFTAGVTFAFDLEDLGFYYSTYRKIMAHWNQVLSLPIHDVVYEDIVADPEKEIRKLLEFCNLPWNEKCLEFNKNARNVLTASYNQVRQPIYGSSIARWKNYEHHIKPLIDSLRNEHDV
jgi:tetratricopeptide (TPR) repeat protein